jgi:hypothetical protein
MRKDVIRLSRRRRPRVHIIKHDATGRTVRDASSFPGCEHSLAPMPILACPRPGGHHERHPLAANSNGPPLTRKATLEIYTVARSSQDLPPRCFTTPPGGGFRPPPGTEHPQGCLHAPPGVVAKPLRVRTTPRVLAALPGGDSFQDARLTMSATLYLRYPTSGETGRSFRR